MAAIIFHIQQCTQDKSKLLEYMCIDIIYKQIKENVSRMSKFYLFLSYKRNILLQTFQNVATKVCN